MELTQIPNSKNSDCRAVCKRKCGLTNKLIIRRTGSVLEPRNRLLPVRMPRRVHHDRLPVERCQMSEWADLAKDVPAGAVISSLRKPVPAIPNLVKGRSVAQFAVGEHAR